MEPLRENVRYIQKNFELNKIKGDILRLAVSNKPNKVAISVDEDTMSRSNFGLHPGSKEVKFDSITWTQLLSRYKYVSIIKSDCEGCEKFLADVDNSLLQRFESWVIEAHSDEIKSLLAYKFSKCGFDVVVHPWKKGIYILVVRKKINKRK